MKHFTILILLIITSFLCSCSTPKRSTPKRSTPKRSTPKRSTPNQINKPNYNVPMDMNCLKIKAKIISVNENIVQLEIIEVIKYGRSAPILTKGTKIEVKTKLILSLNEVKILTIEKEPQRMGDNSKKLRFRLKKIIK